MAEKGEAGTAVHPLLDHLCRDSGTLGAALVVRPLWCGPCGAALVVRPLWCGPCGAALVVRPGCGVWCGPCGAALVVREGECGGGGLDVQLQAIGEGV